MAAYRGSAPHLGASDMKICILSAAFTEVWADSLVRDHLEVSLGSSFCVIPQQVLQWKAQCLQYVLEGGGIQRQKGEGAAKLMPYCALEMCFMVLGAGPPASSLSFRALSLERDKTGLGGRVGVEESLARGAHVVGGLWLLSCPSRDAPAQGRGGSLSVHPSC